MTVVARDLKNNDTTDAGFDLLTDPTTIGAVTGDAGITRILFGSTGVDGGFAQGSAADGMLVNLGSNNDVTVTGTVTVDTELPAAAALADNAANPTTVTVGAALLAFDGTTWDRVTIGGGVEATALRVTIASDSTGVLSVDDNGGSLTVDGTVAATQSGTWNVTNVSGTVSLPTGASTLAEQQTQTTALQLLDDVVATGGSAALTKGYQIAGSDGTNAQVIATDASGHQRVIGGPTHDAVVSSRPVTIGARASTAVPTAVSADGDSCHIWVDRQGAVKMAVVDDAGDSAMDGTNNAVRVNVVAGGAGDGSILDGVSGAIKATVLDYTNSNPLAVRLTDTAGDYIAAGAGTQYTEDAAAAADPIGTQVVLVRKDTPATITSADGDVIAQRATNYGAAYVQLVTSAGAFIDSVGGGTEYTEDAAAAADPVGKAMIFVRQDTLSTTTVSADGDNIAARGSSTGAQYVEITNGTTKIAAGGGTEATALRVTVASDSTGVLSVDDNGGSLTVDGTVSISGAVDTELPAAAALADNAANPTTVLVGSCLLAFDGTTWDRVTVGGGVEATALRVTIANDSTGVVSIDDNGSSLTVDGTVAVTGVSTLAEQQTQTTALQLIDDIVYTDDTSTHATGTSKGALIMGAATPTDAAVNANDIGAVAMSLNRELHVSVQTALPTGSNAIGKLAANTGVDIGDVDVTSIVPGTGATNLGKAEDVGHVTGDVGVMALAVRTDTQAARAGATDDYIPLTTDALGNLYVRDYPQTTGGLSISRDLDADETETEAKSTAGQLYGYYFANTHATSWRYLKFYNADAATVVVGTTTPVLTLGLPAASAGHVEFSKGIAFSTAICFAVTTGVADNDTGAPGANEVVVNVFYK